MSDNGETKKTEEERSAFLANALYAAQNTSDWVWKVAGNPPKGKSKNLDAVQLIGVTLIVEDSPINVTTGNMFAYTSYYLSNQAGKISTINPQNPNISAIQGLSGVAANPLLYGTMAPDQYILPTPQNLDDTTINLILDALNKNNKEITNLEMLQSELRIPLFTDVAQNFGPLDEIKAIVNKYISSPLTQDENKVVVSASIQTFIGKQHVIKIAENISENNPQRYAAISIAGKGQSEGIGFNAFHSENQEINAHKTGEGHPTVAWYKGKNTDPLSDHFIIQSKSDIGIRVEEQKPIAGEINITGSDFDQIVMFYEETMAKGIPVAVNCTDGVDRTGMVMVALQMLHHSVNLKSQFNQDFSALSEHGQQSQILNIIEGLKKDRGPAFLRSTKDVAIAVMMGYTLISTKNQMDFEAKIKEKTDIYPNLNKLLAKKPPNEPDVLLSDLNELIGDLTSPEKEVAEKLLNLVEKRVNSNNDFILTNDHTNSKFQEIIEPIENLKSARKDGSKNAEITPGKKVTLADIDKDTKKPFKVENKKTKILQIANKEITLKKIEEATLADFVDHIERGFDPHIPLKENKSAYDFALKKFFDEADPEVRKGFLALAQIKSEDKKILEIADKLMIKPKDKSVKEELSKINTTDKQVLEARLNQISTQGDKKTKNMVKNIIKLLPTQK